MLITITYKVMSVLLKKSYNREEKLKLLVLTNVRAVIVAATECCYICFQFPKKTTVSCKSQETLELILI